MLKLVTLGFSFLLLTSFMAVEAHAKGKAKGRPAVGPYVGKEMPPPAVLARMCKKKPDQVVGRLQTGPDQYTVYMAVIGAPGVVNAHPATLVKLNSDIWILGCLGGIPQVVLK